MLATILISTILLLIGFVLLSFKILFFKNGSFPTGHVSSIKPLRDNGISCATSQDRDAQKKNKRMNITEIEL